MFNNNSRAHGAIGALFAGAKSPREKNSIAQGTIEYLVVIAVIVVISLIVVALVINVSSSPSQQVLDSSKKLGGSATGGIRIVESVVDSDGDSLVKLSNNYGDFIYLTKITLCDGVVNDYGDVGEQIVSGDSKLFSLSSTTCRAGEKSKLCQIKIEYNTREGLSKTDLKEVNVMCVNDSSPNPGGGGGHTNEPIEPILELGTLEHPWIINDCLELQDMNQHLDGNYALGNNINCSDTINWNGGAGFDPIGNCGPNNECQNGDYSYTFKGNFNGNNHTISNLVINLPSTNYVGLFAYTIGGNIQDVGLVNVSISGSYYVGGLVGAFKGPAISNSYSSGNVTGYMVVGGLVGASTGSISNSYSTGTISGSSYVGGLVGGAGTDLIVSNSYSTGDVSGSYKVGGLVGWQPSGSISNSYAIGGVSGLGKVGGLVGWQQTSDSSISNSYSIGAVVGSSDVGGLVGISEGSITNAYYDSETSGQSDTGKGEPRTTTQMNQQATYENWDFVDTWEINEGVSYPILFWQ